MQALRLSAGLSLILSIMLTVVTVTASAEHHPASDNPNHPSYWEHEFPGSTCVKTDTVPDPVPADAVAVIVKGGPDRQVYTPPFPDEMTAPINPKTERPYGTSHVITCQPTQSPTTIITTPSSSTTSTPNSSTSLTTIPTTSTPSTPPTTPTTQITPPSTTSPSSIPTTIPETTQTTDTTLCLPSALGTSADSTTTMDTQEPCTPGTVTPPTTPTHTTLPFTGSTLPVDLSALWLAAGVLLAVGFVLVKRVDVH